jgi:DNA replication protein DnaC
MFGSERLTGALLDRLTHHVHILEMSGQSYRVKQRKKQQRQQNEKSPDQNASN